MVDLSELELDDSRIEQQVLRRQMSFLGREFLTWLWYKCEAEKGQFVLPRIGQVGVFFDDLLVLESESTGSREDILKRGTPSHSGEAKTGLLLGKKVGKAKLFIGRGENEWLLTIDAENFDFQSVKLPKAESLDPEQKFQESVLNMEEAVEIMDQLYKMFLVARLDPSFEKTEVPAMQKWMVNKAVK